MLPRPPAEIVCRVRIRSDDMPGQAPGNDRHPHPGALPRGKQVDIRPVLSLRLPRCANDRDSYGAQAAQDAARAGCLESHRRGCSHPQGRRGDVLQPKRPATHGAVQPCWVHRSLRSLRSEVVEAPGDDRKDSGPGSRPLRSAHQTTRRLSVYQQKPGRSDACTHCVPGTSGSMHLDVCLRPHLQVRQCAMQTPLFRTRIDGASQRVVDPRSVVR